MRLRRKCICELCAHLCVTHSYKAWYSSSSPGPDPLCGLNLPRFGLETAGTNPPTKAWRRCKVTGVEPALPQDASSLIRTATLSSLPDAATSAVTSIVPKEDLHKSYCAVKDAQDQYIRFRFPHLPIIHRHMMNSNIRV
jgi:hypothetical protein